MVIATTNLGKNTTVNPTHVVIGEKLLNGLSTSSIGFFLLNNQVIEVRSDESKIIAEIEHLQKCIINTYLHSFFLKYIFIILV